MILEAIVAQKDYYLLAKLWSKKGGTEGKEDELDHTHWYLTLPLLFLYFFRPPQYFFSSQAAGRNHEAML